MTDHAHCYCIASCLSETHTGGFEIDEKGKKKPIRREDNTRDAMCCFCGRYKEGRLKFVQTEGHGLLRHLTVKAPKDTEKK